MSQFKDIISGLKIQTVKYIPGEHDAALDNAQAYREFFGDPASAMTSSRGSTAP
jgi:hypothetical protein